MGLLVFLIVGAIAGWLAGQVMRGAGFGLLGDIVIGVIGAFLGSYVFGLAGVHVGGGWIGSIAVAFVGALLLLFIIRLFTGGRRRRVWS